MSDKPTTGGDDIIALTERIATLELELDAYAAHASGLQARLLSTLDALQQARVRSGVRRWNQGDSLSES